MLEGVGQHIWLCLETFLVFMLEEGVCYWHLEGKVQVCCQTSPLKTSYLTPNVNSSEVEKSRGCH